MTSLLDKEVLTTGEVAKICNVAPRTVSKWFDSGQLEGYRIPGSKDRRIPVGQLIRFMKSHNIPIEGAGGGQIRVLVVDSDPDVRAALSNVLREQTEYEVQLTANAFEAGVLAHRLKPHVMLLDMHIGGDETGVHRVADFLGADDEMQLTSVIAMSGKLTDGQAAQLRRQGFEGFLKKPFQVRQVIDAIEKATAIVR